MALARFCLSPSLALLIVLSQAPARAARCTRERDELFFATRARAPRKCLVQSSFQVCDDECLKAVQELIAVSADCGTSAQNLYKIAKYALDECVEFRVNATNKYMPQASTGLEPCSLDQLNEWELTYGIDTAAGNCSKSSSSCTEDCVKILEDSISNAAVCAEKGEFALGETKKPALLRCLMQHETDPSGNAVLQTVVHGDGTTTRANTIVLTSPPPLATADANPVVASGSNASVGTSMPSSTGASAAKELRAAVVTAVLLLGVLYEFA